MKYQAGGHYEGELFRGLREGRVSAGRCRVWAVGQTLWGLGHNPAGILTQGLTAWAPACSPVH